MKMLALAASLMLATAQDTTADADLAAAIKATAEKGFTYVIKPVADIPNFESARDELAGATVKGEYSGGVFHAQDGMFEIYRKGDKVAVKTQSGWLGYDAFTSPVKQAIKEAFEAEDGRRWRKGNVTKGREALSQLIRLDHLVHRANIERLTNLATAFSSIKRAGSPSIDGKPSVLYEGDLSDTAAFNILQGPFDELVKRGNLSFQKVSGVGSLWIQEGLVRKVHARIGGKYTFYHEDDNAERKGFCALGITAEITKVGETKVDPPAEASKLLN